MIRIRITDIPTRGLEISDSISLEALNARMNEAPDNDIQFLTPPSFVIQIKPESAGANVQGEIETSYCQPCGVCLEPVTRVVKQSLALTLKAKTARPGIDRPTSGSEWEDDVGIVYFDGEHIDLEEIFQETLILSINPFDSSHPECPGLPKEAAADKEPEAKITLGDLLKNVRLN